MHGLELDHGFENVRQAYPYWFFFPHPQSHSLEEPVEGVGHLARSSKQTELAGRVVAVTVAVASSNAQVDLHVR